MASAAGMAARETPEAREPREDPEGGERGPENGPQGGADPNGNPEGGERASGKDSERDTDAGGGPEGEGALPDSESPGASAAPAEAEGESGGFKKPLLPAVALSGPLPRRAKKPPVEAVPAGPQAPGDAAARSDAGEAEQVSGPSCRGPARGPDIGSQRQQQQHPAEPPLEYTEPAWSGEADEAAVPFGLEVLKGGTVVGSVPLTGASYFVVGRLESCSVRLEHPSVSRRHAVLQHRAHGRPEQRGLYLYDLGSSHGSFVNKARVEPRRFHRVRVGHVLRFGGSTRLLVLQGPSEDEEAEAEETPTELQELNRRQRAELERRMLGDEDEEDDQDEDEESKGHAKRARGGKAAAAKASGSEEYAGCTWGMDMDDADEEEEEKEEEEENPFAAGFLEEKEAFYVKDPKKALKGFFDREGLELEYEFDQQAHGSWLCRVSLPVEDASGHEVMAEVVTTGKKKDAVVQCALEACRMLDARGMLRQEAVSRKRKSKDWEEADYYDSDDDSFLDRTGVVEYKRRERMRKAGRVQDRAETYDSLVAKLGEVERELEDVDRQLKVAAEAAAREAQAEDSLDAYMSEVRAGATLDSAQRKRMRVRAFELRKEQQRLRRLASVARPAALPPLLPPQGVDSKGAAGDKPKKMLPLTGAMRGGSRLRLKTGAIGGLPVKRPVLPSSLFNTKSAAPEEEDEEDEEEDEEEVCVLVCAAVMKVRPYLVACRLRGLELGEGGALKRFLGLQTELHEGVCKRRSLATIATHDLRLIRAPLRFDARPPADIQVTPLGSSACITALSLVEDLQGSTVEKVNSRTHHKVSGLHQYLHLLQGQAMYPFLVDRDGVTISLPPITNSQTTKVSVDTTEVLVEVTSSHSLASCKLVMDTLITRVAELHHSLQQLPGTINPDETQRTGTKKALEVMQVVVLNEADGCLRVMYPSRTDLTATNINVVW